MGALGFFGGFANAVGRSRQAQADPIDQALKLYQLRQAITEDPLRRALLNKQLSMEGKTLVKMPDGTSQLIDLSNPSAPGQTIGTPRNYERDLRNLSMAAPDSLKPLIQSAISSGDPVTQEQVLKIAQDAIAKGATQKPSYFDEELNLYKTDPKTYAGMKAAGRNPPNKTNTNTPFGLWKQENPNGTYADWMNASAAGKNVSTVNDINTALDQMQDLVGQLRTKPGVLGGIASEARGLAGAAGGYADPAEFKQQASLLADLIPKALSGRANQSSINYALKYDVPSFWDTRDSAQRKINALRQLFVKYGVIPPASASGVSSASPPNLSKMTADVGTPVYNAEGRVTSFTPASAPRDTP